MKIILFGGAGFLGSHVAEALTRDAHAVTVYDLRQPAQQLPGQSFIQGDILDAAQVRKALEGQEVAYHFAGLADLDDAQDKAVETARANVLGTATLLEEARRAKLKRFVYASTIYVAGQSGGFYRASKQSCELFVEEAQRRYGLDYTILRYGSIYGRRADKNNGVKGFLTQALRDRKITVSGTGDETREYVHVTDVAEASVRILEPEFKNECVVLTGHQAMRVRDLMEMIREIVGQDVTVEYRPVEAARQAQGKTAHYTVTPYSFRPKIAKKLVGHRYVDMGQGLIDCLEEIHSRLELD